MLRVLMVEDNPHFREIFKIVFRNKFPFLVLEEAENGQEALQKINGGSPDLIFLDILLPEENGLALAQEIKRDFPNIRIAMLTSYDSPENRRTAAKLGADRFFIKDSLNWEEIKEWIASVSDTPGKR